MYFQDRSNAQSSCAGLFINAHLGFDFPGVWLHVDMASPSHVVSSLFDQKFFLWYLFFVCIPFFQYPYSFIKRFLISIQGERATGYGVALLNVLFSNHIKASMLQVTERNGPESHANGVKKQRLNQSKCVPECSNKMQLLNV